MVIKISLIKISSKSHLLFYGNEKVTELGICGNEELLGIFIDTKLITLMTTFTIFVKNQVKI